RGRLDEADPREVPRDRAALTELTLAEEHADVGRRAVLVVREALDDDGDLVGREALVGHDLVVGRVVEQAGALLDGALEGVFGHRRLLRLLDGEAEAGVAGWVRTTSFRCDDDLFGELAERAALGVCALLATLLLPLSTHG